MDLIFFVQYTMKSNARTGMGARFLLAADVAIFLGFPIRFDMSVNIECPGPPSTVLSCDRLVLLC